jgi:hypothetical protein
MYIPQLFETISQPLHTERIIDAERERLASASGCGSSAERNWAVGTWLRRVAVAMQTLAFGVGRQSPAEPHRLSSPRE